jgi:hypothetical protein
MNHDCHPAEQQARQEQLEAWYKKDGRHATDHPDHATYTGLAAKYAAQEVAE